MYEETLFFEHFFINFEKREKKVQRGQIEKQ